MVGAGALVTKEVKNFSLVIGSPAKHYKWISRNGVILDRFNMLETSEKYKLN